MNDLSPLQCEAYVYFLLEQFGLVESLKVSTRSEATSRQRIIIIVIINSNSSLRSSLFSTQLNLQKTSNFIGTVLNSYRKVDYHNIHHATQVLCHLRATSPALQTGALEILSADEENNTVVYQRTAEKAKVLITINLSPTEQTVTLPLTAGTWLLPLTGEQLQISKPVETTYTLRSGETLLFTTPDS